jgi:hypothetical protein
MIQIHKITKSIRTTMIWLVVTNYGRFALGMIMCLFGVFSEYGTIPVLSTDLAIFTYITNAGVILLIGQFNWVVIRSLYLWIYNKS